MNHFAEKMACQFNLDLSMVRKWASAMSGLILILLLVVSTATSVWWVATNEMRDREVELRGLHLAEIERLQKAYGDRLERQMTKNEDTAAKVEAIATTLETNTAAVGEVTTAVEAASAKVGGAAAQATRAAQQVQRATSQRAAPDRALPSAPINRRVEQINREIRSK